MVKAQCFYPVCAYTSKKLAQPGKRIAQTCLQRLHVFPSLSGSLQRHIIYSTSGVVLLPHLSNESVFRSQITTAYRAAIQTLMEVTIWRSKTFALKFSGLPSGRTYWPERPLPRLYWAWKFWHCNWLARWEVFKEEKWEFNRIQIPRLSVRQLKDTIQLTLLQQSEYLRRFSLTFCEKVSLSKSYFFSASYLLSL